MSAKQIIAYFPNWGTYNINHQNINVGMIPWDKVTVIQHAFFAIGSQWNLVSTDEWADFKKTFEHSEAGSGGLKGHIGEYKYYKSIYPKKKLLLSIGGWTRSYNFSQMAANSQYRSIFINSCIAFLNRYPFFDGLDIDWEYPQVQDKNNFTILLKELRIALNQNDMLEKWITIAVPAGIQNIENQDIENYKEYVNLINIMTYDYYGAWNDITSHHSPLYNNPTNPYSNGKFYNVEYSVNKYLEAGVPKENLCIGTPFYSRGWKNVDLINGLNDGLYAKGEGAPVGSWDEFSNPGGQNPWFQMKKLEGDISWEKHYDDKSKAPYLINRNEKYFLTYEDEESLKEKCRYIIANGLGGIIIWDISGDDLTNDAPMTTIPWTLLIKNEEENDIQEEEPPKSAIGTTNNLVSLDGNYTVTFTIDANNSATSFELYENNEVIKLGLITGDISISQNIIHQVVNKAEGIYFYKMVLRNKFHSTTSKLLIINVKRFVKAVDNPNPPTIVVDKPSNKGEYTISILNPPQNNAKKLVLFENDKEMGTVELTENINQEVYQTNFTKKEPGSYVYKSELSNDNGKSVSEPITVIVTSTTSPENEKLPTVPILYHNNWEGSPDYSITSNMWWGVNATKLYLYENNELIDSKELTDNTPNAQSATWNMSNMANGVYQYNIVAENNNQRVQSIGIIINVTKGESGKVKEPNSGILSVNASFNKGIYNLALAFPANNSACEYKLLENDIVVKSGLLTVNKSITEVIVITYTDKPSGKYVYKLVLDNGKKTANSNLLEVTVDSEGETPENILNGIMNFELLSDWGTEANFTITMTNNSNISMEKWSLEFDFDKKITKTWDVNMIEEKNHYTLSNPSWGGIIQAGESFSIMGVCQGNVGLLKPRNARINGKSIPIQ